MKASALMLPLAALFGGLAAWLLAPALPTAAPAVPAPEQPRPADDRAAVLAAMAIPDSLRPPPVPVAPQPVVVAAPAEVPAPALRLVGTIIERSHAQAIFRDTSGKTVRVGIGDVVDGCLVIQVERDRATVSRDQRDYEFTIASAEAKP